jgi:hypothetical protein
MTQPGPGSDHILCRGGMGSGTPEIGPICVPFDEGWMVWHDPTKAPVGKVVTARVAAPRTRCESTRICQSMF